MGIIFLWHNIFKNVIFDNVKISPIHCSSFLIVLIFLKLQIFRWLFIIAGWNLLEERERGVETMDLLSSSDHYSLYENGWFTASQRYSIKAKCSTTSMFLSFSF